MSLEDFAKIIEQFNSHGVMIFHEGASEVQIETFEKEHNVKPHTTKVACFLMRL